MGMLIFFVLFPSLYQDPKSKVAAYGDSKEEMPTLETAKQSKPEAKEENLQSSNEDQEIEITITKQMSYEAIADVLIEQGVYPHKNDLLMLMEMINYDKYRGAKVLSAKGIIPDVAKHQAMLQRYDMQRYEIKKELYAKQLIQSEDAFSKVLYLLDGDTRILPGKKKFRHNLSLREIADVLMAKDE